MPDFLSMVERGLKAVRYGIFQASDNLAMLLDGFCRAPEVYPRYEMTAPGSFVIPDSAAGSPQNAAVVAPSPKGSDSPPRDSAIPPGALGGHSTYEMTLHRMERLESGAWLGFSDDYPGKQFLIVLRPGFEK